MTNKKLYYIIKVTCIVVRHSGMKEYDTFSFLIRSDIYSLDQENRELKKQLFLYNQFATNDFIIEHYENEEFEKVGEIWL